MKSNILVVEDDSVWRSALTQLINHEADLQVVFAAATKEEALAYCADHLVDVVLMDLNLTGHQLDGIQATLELNLANYPAKVIVLTSMQEKHIILDAFTAGAIHYVNKDDFRKIPELIRSVLHQTSPQELLVKEFIRLKEAEQYNQLTPAEKEIVSLSEEGNGRTQILSTLGKSESTVKKQVSSILRKFDAKSLKQVVSFIRNRGIREEDNTP